MRSNPMRLWLCISVAVLVSGCALQRVTAQSPAPAVSGRRAPFDPPARTVLRQPIVTIPLERVDGDPFYYARVLVNGRPFRFTIETGAGVFAISPRAAAALGLTADTVEIVPGSRGAVVYVDSLTVGQAAFHGLAARITEQFDAMGFD